MIISSVKSKQPTLWLRLTEADKKGERVFTYRKTTPSEDMMFGLQCTVILDNSMKCPRRVTRMLNGKYLCEGHFQPYLQGAIADKEVIINIDEPRENLTGESEPTEKVKADQSGLPRS